VEKKREKFLGNIPLNLTLKHNKKRKKTFLYYGSDRPYLIFNFKNYNVIIILKEKKKEVE
jgi:hypothetical protein